MKNDKRWRIPIFPRADETSRPEPIFSTHSNLGMRTRAWKKLGEGILILFAIAFSSWLMFHTFSYDAQNNEMRIAFKLWSDFGAHIPLIRSFSMGANWDRLMHVQMIEYPIFPGEPIRYHYIFYMLVGIMEKMGVRIDWALNIPSILGFFGLMIGIHLLAKKLFQSHVVAVLSVLFFLFNGSLSFIRFFELHPLSLTSWQDIMHATDFPAFAPWGQGDITAFWNLNIYTNQRHLAGAFALIIFFIITCLHIQHRPFPTQLPWAIGWAVLIGILPFYHQPALLIIGILMTVYFFVFPTLRRFLFAIGVWAALIVLPQIIRTKETQQLVQWYPGYIVHQDIEKISTIWQSFSRMVVFWWQNMGIHSVFMPLGFFLIPKQARKIMLPILPLFVIGNLLKFSVEVGANHKFFNFVMILGHMISAYTLVQLFRSIKSLSRHWIIGLLDYLVIGLLIVFLTLSGVIDFFVVANDTIGSLQDIPKAPVATWIAHNTPVESRMLNSSLFYHPAGIAGREIFMGWPYFSWSAGYDSYARKKDMKIMFESDDFQAVCDLLKHYHLDYVTYETREPFSEIAFHEDVFQAHFQKIYHHAESGITIYKTPAQCL